MEPTTIANILLQKKKVLPDAAINNKVYKVAFWKRTDSELRKCQRRIQKNVETTREKEEQKKSQKEKKMTQPSGLSVFEQSKKRRRRNESKPYETLKFFYSALAQKMRKLLPIHARATTTCS
jgi:hypothetical protein